MKVAGCLTAPGNNFLLIFLFRLLTLVSRFAELLLDADRAIDAIPDLSARLVLKMYYLEEISTKDIADRMHYSKQHINRLINKGYQLMEVPEEKIPA